MKQPFLYYLSSLFPGTFTQLAYRKLTRPQIRKLRSRELNVLEKAEQKDIRFKGGSIRTYHWGSEGEAVLLVHGWEGQAGNFADLIPKLQKAGFQIWAFDGPSHGFSSTRPTSLFEFVELVGFLIEQWEVRQLVSHSFGGVATTFALAQQPELAIERYALLTVPNRFQERIDYVFAQTGLHPKVKARLIQRLESREKIKVSELDVSKFVQQVKVRQSLIIQDKDDQVVTLQQSRQVHQNWPVSELRVVEGTGHFRILRDPAVIKMVTNFLSTSDV